MQKERSMSPALASAIQEFQRTMTMAVADTLPGGKSEYQKLKIKQQDEDVSLWQWLEGQIAAEVLRWPEWGALMGQQPDQSKQQGKAFDRYSGIRKKVQAPSSFADFNESFRTTADTLLRQTMDNIGKAVIYSLRRLENHAGYQTMVTQLRKLISVDKAGNIPEALPLLDICQPTRLASDITDTLVQRLQDEIKAIEELAYPYDQNKSNFANLAIVLRLQVQIKATYQDRFSRLVAAAEKKFSTILHNEVLQGEILPWVRSTLLDSNFLHKIAR
jgi:hypothetical protein